MESQRVEKYIVYSFCHKLHKWPQILISYLITLIILWTYELG